MAAAKDATSSSTAGASASFSWNHTCGGGQRVLVVVVAHASFTARTCTSITYNGVAMHSFYDNAVAGSGIGISGFYLENPASGTHSIAVTMSGAATNKFQGFAISLKGVDQTSITTGTATGFVGSSQTATNTLSITPDVANAMIVSCATIGNNSAAPATTNASMTTQIAWTAAVPDTSLATLLQTTAQAETLGWDNSSSGNVFWAQVIIAFIPAQAITSSASFTLTGQNATLTGARKAVISAASFTLTGAGALFRRVFLPTNASGHTATPSNVARSTATVTNQASHTASVTNVEL